MQEKQVTFNNFKGNNPNIGFNIKKFYVKQILLFFLIPFLLMGFKGIKYNTITKKIDGVEYKFQIPSTFCEYDVDVPDGVIQFLKCHQIELLKERQPVFFSERIYISYDTAQENIQNVTDKFFANLKKQSYENSSEKDKNAYLYSPIYPLKNKQKVSLINDTYIFERSGLNEDGSKYKNYEANLFLNKRNFTINWIQFLTQYEDFIEQKTFTDFVQENKNNNIEQSYSLYRFPSRQIIVTKPKFGNFANYTNIKKYNNGEFIGIFGSLLDKENDKIFLMFKISIIQENMDAKEVFESLFKKNEEKQKDKLNIEIITYKDDNFIKITKNDFIMYLCYIDFSYNMTGIVSLETPQKNNDDTVKYLYKYKQQLIEDNL